MPEMYFRGRGNMISSDTHRRKLVLLGFLLLVGCLPPVRSVQYDMMNTSSLIPLRAVNDSLVSPSKHFELGIFPYAGDGNHYLCIRYSKPIKQAVTFVANRNHPVSSSAVLQFNNNGTLELHNPGDNSNPTVWTTTNGIKAVKASLSDAGNLILMDGTGNITWDSFKHDVPTDTLLPGQYMYRNQSHNLTSWQKDGNPAIAKGSYSFMWTENILKENILSLTWTSPVEYIKWTGGPYVPAPDVHAAHKIDGVDYVYFHKTLGHLYINSTPADTSILSGGSDRVSATTLKRITMCTDGGLRICQWTINQNSTTWTAVANWLLSERPDTRSQCTAYGTCGPYGQCISPVDSLLPVQCKCPDGFVAKDTSDLAQGCNFNLSSTPPKCTDGTSNATFVATTDPASLNMTVLEGVDLPWGGDYLNLTGPASANCMELCRHNCWCAGAVYSADEQACWLKTGILYNIGYPTSDLHGTNRIAYIRTTEVQTFQIPSLAPSSKEQKKTPLALIVAPAVVGGVVVVVSIVAFIWCCFKGKLRETFRSCKLVRTQSTGSGVSQFSGTDSEDPRPAPRPAQIAQRRFWHAT